jgi:REP element-mobilizing transposase RayT
MIRTQHDLTDKTWFITFTCYQWISLFEITNSYDLVYNWLNLIAEKYQIQCFGFAIMPNHVHLLLNLPDSVKSLNTVISNGKRFMAYELISRLQQQKQDEILSRLSVGCSEKEKAKGQKHKVFEPSFDAKPVYTLDFLNQKLTYMHNNPVTGKWNLCNEFTDYPHSSAAFYVDDKPHSMVNIADYRMTWF